MRLTEDLLNLAKVAPDKHRNLLEAAAEKLQEQRLWRDAWLQQVRENEQLVEELTALRKRIESRNLRKEKECND